MSRFRLSRLAHADLRRILSASSERWGNEGRRRYEAALAAAMRRVAGDPDCPTSRGRDELRRGVRSFHVRHALTADSATRVRRPVHVLYYRVVEPGLVEIVRVLHERVEPSQHLGD